MDTGRNCTGKRKRHSVALAAALAFVVAVLGGAGRSAAKPLNVKRESATKVDTAEIKKTLEAKLSRDARFSVTSVNVDPASGIVTLSGRVATEADRDAVGRLASSVKGVSMIYNEIQPEKPGP